MDESCGRFCRLYRPIGALLLLLVILILLLRACNAPTPVATAPTVEVAVTAVPTVAPTAVPPTVAPTAVPPTVAPPTALPIAVPKLDLPAAADFSADGVKLSGTGQPGATVEVWDGSTKIGTAVVGADGKWSLVGKLGEGARKLTVRTVDAGGKTLNESAALDVTVPKTAAAIAVPKLNVPAAADFSADGVRLSGTGQPGATIEVWDGATKVGTAVVGADGKWSLVGKLGEGAHKMTVRTVDAGGKTLNESTAVDVTVPKAEAAIAVPKLNMPAVGDFTADGVKLSGTGQPGATIEVWDGTTKVGTAVVGADGKWSLVGKLGEGAHKLTVRTVDASGKALNESAAVDVTVPKAEAPGEAYIVKSGDWLMKLAKSYYGDSSLYPLIVEATNARAAVDPSFAKITNPNRIYPGQKLWIPPKPAGQ